MLPCWRGQCHYRHQSPRERVQARETRDRTYVHIRRHGTVLRERLPPSYSGPVVGGESRSSRAASSSAIATICVQTNSATKAAIFLALRPPTKGHDVKCLWLSANDSERTVASDPVAPNTDKRLGLPSNSLVVTGNSGSETCGCDVVFRRQDYPCYRNEAKPEPKASWQNGIKMAKPSMRSI